MKTGTVTMETSKEVPQKFKHRTTIQSNNATFRYFSKEFETLTQKDVCTPTFIVALYTIAETWKQPEWPLMGEWIKKM